MSTCRFCGRRFANGQAVRAHLKGCVEYLARPRDRQLEAVRRARPSPSNDSVKAILPEALPQVDAPFDPVRQLGQRLTAERIRLELREVEEAHAELDRRARAIRAWGHCSRPRLALMVLDELRLILRMVRRHAPSCYPGLVAALLAEDGGAQGCAALTVEAAE